MAAPVRFDPAHPLPGLEGFTPEFLDDLRDFVAKYGADVRGVAGLRRIVLPASRPAQVSVTVPPSKQRNVSVWALPPDGDASSLCVLLLDDEEHSYVMWDRRCAVADVRAAMAVVDAEMADCRDPATGRRRRVVSDRYAPPPLTVEGYFDRKGKVLMVDRGVDPEAVRYQFDRPEELVVVPDAGGPGRPGICRSADAARAARRHAAVSRVLAAHGIRSQSEIDRMPRDALQLMLAEVEAELDKEDG